MQAGGSVRHAGARKRIVRGGQSSDVHSHIPVSRLFWRRRTLSAESLANPELHPMPMIYVNAFPSSQTFLILSSCSAGVKQGSGYPVPQSGVSSENGCTKHRRKSRQNDHQTMRTTPRPGRTAPTPRHPRSPRSHAFCASQAQARKHASLYGPGGTGSRVEPSTMQAHFYGRIGWG